MKTMLGALLIGVAGIVVLRNNDNLDLEQITTQDIVGSILVGASFAILLRFLIIQLKKLKT